MALVCEMESINGKFFSQMTGWLTLQDATKKKNNFC